MRLFLKSNTLLNLFFDLSVVMMSVIRKIQEGLEQPRPGATKNQL